MTPSGAPSRTEIAVATTPITTSVRGAANTRGKISMPFSSVPNGYVPLGGSRRVVGSATSVGKGAR